MNKKILLPKYRYNNASNEDTQIRVSFDDDHNILKNDDRDVILDLSQQFYDEKNSCNRYQIFGKIKMIFRNMYSGTTNYEYLKDRLSYINNHTSAWEGYLPYDEFAFLRRDVYREINTGYTTSSLDNFSGFTLTNGGVTGHKKITTLDAPTYNWNLYLSYVYSGDTNYPMKYTLSGETQPHLSFVSGDGIIFRVEANDKYYILTSPVKHGMNQDEHIIINNKPYYINSVGNDIYNSELYTLYITKGQVLSGDTFSNLVTGKRCTNINDSGNTTSNYYVRLHKTLTNVNDCSIGHMGFESPIFEEERKVIFETFSGNNDVIVDRNRMESIMYNFKDPFILTGLTNNLGYTPNELYLTTIFRNRNGYFSYPPKIGYSFNFHNNWIDLHFSGDTTNELALSGTTFYKSAILSANNDYEYGYIIGSVEDPIKFISGNDLPKGTTLIGDFIEYIPSELNERVISGTFHKIVNNTDIFDYGQTDGTIYSGASINNPYGLYYQVHHEIKLRELSPYVETSSDINIINLPENAKYFPVEKLWKWRDRYDLGYQDELGYGVDFSYMNDTLYVHKDANFYLRNEKSYKNKEDKIINFKNKTSLKC